MAFGLKDKSGLMEVADIFVVNKSDRPDAQTFTNNIRQMIMENGLSEALVKVIATIASQGVGITELIQAIEAHQITNSQLGAHHKLVAAKVIQLIVAQKMRQVDLVQLEQDLSVAISKPGFNIFEFSQRFK